MTTKTMKSVAEIALETPRAAAVFDEFGIDYCGSGEASLPEACTEARVVLGEVEAALEQVREARLTAESVEWSKESLRRLSDHIVAFHHQYGRRALPRIDHLLSQTLSAHGQKHHDLALVQRQFHILADEMVRHMMKEEQILFPHIVKLEEAQAKGKTAEPAMFGTVRNPVRMMRAEHDSALALLKTIRKLTRDYEAPKDSCTSFQALYAALEEFENDLLQHIQLENEILFPKAEALEEKAGKRK
jgi:regulator of cell morphogenesis and NO signaling